MCACSISVILPMQVPHVGILTNGLTWVFYKYVEGENVIHESPRYEVPLRQNIPWRAAKAAAKGITLRIVEMLIKQNHKYEAVMAFL